MKQKLYKKIFVLISLIFILISCGNNEELVTELNNEEIKYETFVVGGKSLKSRTLEGNILSNNSVKKLSSTSGKVTELNCQAGKEVYSKSLIATITPNLTDPNIKGLLTNRNSLDLQLGNLQGIKLSTVNNLDTQISTLVSSIDSSTEQLRLSNENYDMLVRQKGLTSSDLNTQLKTLEEQLINLNKQKDLLKKSKNEELIKLDSSLQNLKVTSYNTILNILGYIDELYGITNANKNKNYSYENYLSAKDSNLKNNIETTFRELNNIDYKILLGEELSEYQNKLSDLSVLAADGVKKSIESVGALTETNISTYYNTLLGYSNGLLTLKTNLDTILKNNSTISNTYDSQIAALVTNIDSLSGNIDNLKNNKSESTLLGIDVNLTNIKSQINSLKNNLTTLSNNLISLKENKSITIKQLNNQILSLKQNIDGLNINLSPQNIYAGINGIISKNYTSLNTTVGFGTSICEILADGKDSLKLSISSALRLSDGYIYSAEINDNIIFTGSELTLLPSKNSITQNYIYESILNENSSLKVGDKLKILIDYPNIDLDIEILNNEIIEVPIEYVTPRLNGYLIKIKDDKGEVIEKIVKIGEVNFPNIQILEGLKIEDVLIK
ncbi:MAG: hypothetical protein QM490_05480 [Candidatus Gracilibacteria bacterium]